MKFKQLYRSLNKGNMLSIHWKNILEVSKIFVIVKVKAKELILLQSYRPI
jgi:hypothetical protein